MRKTIALAGAAAGLAAVVQAPAQASVQYADDQWGPICSPGGCTSKADGWIVWANRTATVGGSVQDDIANQQTTVYFDAFQGSVKVDSETRTAKVSDTAPVSFRFTIGNPDLPGGIDRIRIQICRTPVGGSEICDPVQWNENRDF
ncbi:hypothetical protein [Kribbella sp. ALI-6-A]|uniref:hypothetical protein n=1 Tax=Kribbella sp. ALI-6-A TaxID=1933817 RepID=UPI00117AC592|nr:hypothetical protein [Kribbella sp. ALI-6-A]